MGLVKVGVIGIGNMGSSHVLKLDQGQIEGATLTAICSRNEESNRMGEKSYNR